MTKDQQQSEGVPTVRTRKPGEVHKRRVDRKGQARKGVPAAVQAPGGEDAADAAKAADAAEAADAAGIAEAEDAAEAAGIAETADAADSVDAEIALEGDAVEEGAEGADALSELDDAAEGGLPARRRSAKRIVLGILTLVAIAAIVAVSFFAWNRWGRYDDAADIQGDWYVEGTAALVTIDTQSIHLSDDVVYDYSIDAHDKTISYSFVNWQGQGRYWFSDDRRHLVITDGSFTGAENTVDDLVQSFTDLGQAATGQPVELPQGDGVIVFSRDPDPAALEAKLAAERAAAAEAAREAAQQEAEDGGYTADDGATSTDDDGGTDDAYTADGDGEEVATSEYDE